MRGRKLVLYKTKAVVLKLNYFTLRNCHKIKYIHISVKYEAKREPHFFLINFAD